MTNTDSVSPVVDVDGEEEEISSGEFSSSSSSKDNDHDSVIALRQVIAELRALGVTDPERRLRIGAVTMGRRVIAKYQERLPNVGPGYLARMVEQGDAFPAVAPRGAQAAPADDFGRFDTAVRR